MLIALLPKCYMQINFAPNVFLFYHSEVRRRANDMQIYDFFLFYSFYYELLIFIRIVLSFQFFFTTSTLYFIKNINIVSTTQREVNKHKLSNFAMVHSKYNDHLAQIKLGQRECLVEMNFKSQFKGLRKMKRL